MKEVKYTTVEDLFNNESIERTYSKDQIYYWITYAQYWETKSLKLANSIINYHSQVDEITDERQRKSRFRDLSCDEISFVLYMETLTRYFNTVTDDEIVVIFEDEQHDLFDLDNPIFQFLHWAKIPVLTGARHYLYINQGYQPSSEHMIKDKKEFLRYVDARK